VITFLEGVLIERHPLRVVIACAGVGYDVAIPLSTFDKLPDVNQSCRILTRLIVREDAHLLFGFATREERALFDLLLLVSRVGPKLALSILSGLSVPQIRQAIAYQDSGMLASVSGVGKKTAERIVVELKDKIEQGGVGDPIHTTPGAKRVGAADEAAAALVALGYTRAEAQEAVTAALATRDGKPTSTEALIREALAVTVP